jgi:hypothetical protein
MPFSEEALTCSRQSREDIRRMAATLPLAALFTLAATRVPASADTTPLPVLPARIRRIVLHTLGGPFYGQPDRRWLFLTPSETLRIWKRPTFGAHWIVWTDGSIWPRHPAPGEAASFAAPGSPAPDTSECVGAGPAKPCARRSDLSLALAQRLVREAAPVYSQVEGRNGSTVGIEVSHSGRSADPFPDAQVRAVAWLVASLLELSHGRLGVSNVVGHKDLDPRPAFVGDRCREGRCLAYVDDAGRPFRRLVDPPEGLFVALAHEGLEIPRGGSEGDAELRRAESIPRNTVPRTEKP